MPINEQSAKIKIEFSYEHVDDNNDVVFKYDMEFSHTEEFGPSLSIYNGDHSLGAQIPIKMLEDTVRYLISRRVMKPINAMVERDNVVTDSQPISNDMPDLDNALLVTPIESFSSSALISDPEQASDAGLSLPVITDGLTSVKTTENSNNISSSEILAERKNAKLKNKNDLVKIKRAKA